MPQSKIKALLGQAEQNYSEWQYVASELEKNIEELLRMGATEEQFAAHGLEKFFEDTPAQYKQQRLP